MLMCLVAVLALAALTAGVASANGRDDHGGKSTYGGNGTSGGNGNNGGNDNNRGNDNRGNQGRDDHGRDNRRNHEFDHRRHHRGPRDPGFTVTPLVADVAGVAPLTDPNLVNGWGISESPTSPWWVSDQGTSKSTLYAGDGTINALVVGVPGGPTGTVANTGTGFLVSNGTKDVPSKFIFATLAGTIQAWTAPPAAAVSTTKADSSATHASYTGLAISADDSTLYAADFANGKVDQWDSAWNPIVAPGAFVDRHLPRGFAPFGIQTLAGNVFVTYAKQPATPGPEVDGPGLGIVDEYSATGVFEHRVGSFGGLNAPWGLAWAPTTGFGSGSGQLLVGNFGDGHINTFTQRAYGRWVPTGQLLGANHRPLAIDGLWGIGFGNGTVGPPAQPTTTLYFAAGPDGGKHGLFGTVTANP
jgi:uncharacterized protein (TIGR03118 family)